jgi:hypothetical protein
MFEVMCGHFHYMNQRPRLSSHPLVDIARREAALGRLANGCEASAVLWTRAKLGELREVLPGGIAFVFAEAIARIGLVQLQHQAIPCDLGDDRGGGDRGADPVAPDDGPLGHWQAGQPPAVDEQQIGRGVELRDSRLHGEMGRSENIKPVHGPCVGDADPDAERLLVDEPAETSAVFRLYQL